MTDQVGGSERGRHVRGVPRANRTRPEQTDLPRLRHRAGRAGRGPVQASVLRPRARELHPQGPGHSERRPEHGLDRGRACEGVRQRPLRRAVRQRGSRPVPRLRRSRRRTLVRDSGSRSRSRACPSCFESRGNTSTTGLCSPRPTGAPRSFDTSTCRNRSSPSRSSFRSASWRSSAPRSTPSRSMPRRRLRSSTRRCNRSSRRVPSSVTGCPRPACRRSSAA